jgi:hypothetical protein
MPVNLSCYRVKKKQFEGPQVNALIGEIDI